MQKRSKNIITNISLFVLLALILLLAFFYYRPKSLTTSSNNKRNFQVRVKQLNSKLQDIWLEGDIDRLSKEEKLECKDLDLDSLVIGSDFYRCNPLYLNCVLKNFKLNGFKALKFNDRFYEYDKLGNTVVSFDSDYGVFRIRLYDQCGDVYLPQKKYSAGTKNTQKYLWDNMNQIVYIDKFYVSNLDVLEWKRRKGKKLNKLDKKAIQYPYRPSTYLSFEQRKVYCYEQGKKLLESRYFDAASYLPPKSENQKLIRKFPYHWTKKRSLEKKDCYNIYSKDCEKDREYKFYEGLATSWIGMHFALGNYPESLANKFIKEKDLKVSSFHYLWQSPWHEIGQRDYWNSGRNMDYEDHEVAFRCMTIR